jgi:hypothetical protein
MIVLESDRRPQKRFAIGIAVFVVTALAAAASLPLFG